MKGCIVELCQRANKVWEEALLFDNGLTYYYDDDRDKWKDGNDNDSEEDYDDNGDSDDDDFDDNGDGTVN